MMGTARKMGSRLKLLVLTGRKRKGTLMVMGTMLSMLERRKTRLGSRHLFIVNFSSDACLVGCLTCFFFLFFSGCMA